MKRSVFLMTVLLWVIYSLRTFALTGTDWQAVIKPLASQVARLEILSEGDDSPAICSGVVLNDKGSLLTAQHCVDKPASQVIAMTVNGRHAVVVRENKLLDLAIVRFDPKKETPIAVATDTPDAGAEIAVIGFGFGIEKVAVQFGRVVQPYNRETKSLWTDAPSLPGDSGGGVINDKGELIGITSRIYYRGPSAVSAAVPLEVIKDFADGHFQAPKKP